MFKIEPAKLKDASKRRRSRSPIAPFEPLIPKRVSMVAGEKELPWGSHARV